MCFCEGTCDLVALALAFPWYDFPGDQVATHGGGLDKSRGSENQAAFALVKVVDPDCHAGLCILNEDLVEMVFGNLYLSVVKQYINFGHGKPPFGIWG